MEILETMGNIKENRIIGVYKKKLKILRKQCDNNIKKY